jgi:chromosome segregation ATPase
MSIQFDSRPELIGDRDPTASLPVLDVRDYEKTMLEGDGDEISRTDSWQVDTLRALDTVAEKSVPGLKMPGRGPRPMDQQTPELSGDVDLILKRIAELEGQVLATRTLNAELEHSLKALGAERDLQVSGLAAIQADNVRLTEHRAIGTEMVARLEEKLRDLAAQHAARVASLQSEHSDERDGHEKLRVGLQQHLTDQTLQLAALQKDYQRLREDFVKATDLAASRAASIAGLESLLAQSETSAHQLARQLASKLVDFESQSRTVELRNRTINDLRASAEALGGELRTSIATVNELSEKLATTRVELSDERALLGRRSIELADRDGRITQLCKEIRQAQDELLTLSTQRDASLRALEASEKAQSIAQSELAQQKLQIDGLQGALQSAQANNAKLLRDLRAAEVMAFDEQEIRRAAETTLGERSRQVEALQQHLDATRASVKALTEERNSLLPLRRELSDTSARLEHNVQALSDAKRDFAILKSEFETQTHRAQMVEAELAALQRTADEVRTDRDSLQRSLLETQQSAEVSRQQVHSQSQSLQEKIGELRAVQTAFHEQGSELEGLRQLMDSRDELIGALRHQLQQTQNEHKVSSEQIAESEQRMQALLRLVANKSRRVAALKSDLAVYGAALAAIRRNLHRLNGEATDEAVPTDQPRYLEPVEHNGAVITLESSVTTIGRTNENDVCVPSKLISRRHARLLATPNGVIVEDAESTNGCFVNGRKVRQQLMREGDILSLGELRYRLCGAPTSETRVRTNVIDISERRQAAD